MDTSKFAEIRTFHVDGGWHDAYWLRKARVHAARTLAESIVHLWTVGIVMLKARRALSAMPTESSSYLDRDEVANAKRILLGL